MNPDQNSVPTKIMIVDDATALRGVLRAFFRGEGYDVVGEHANGAGVLDDVGRLQPDIVCLDYNLPDINGMELLRAIHAAHPTVAVVMITGEAAPELESEAAEGGAAGFIRKPFSQERISKEIHQVARLQNMHKAQTENKPFGVKKARARAVVADDSATMRMLLASLLRHAGVEVVGEAVDGRQAIDLVARHGPDLVCIDVDMPVMNGLDALAAIKAQTPQARVLMVTGRADREMVLEAAKRGATGYIVKPFDPDTVIEAIDKLLGQPPG